MGFHYTGQQNSNYIYRGLTGDIWKHILGRHQSDPSAATFMFEDFNNFPTLADNGTWNGWVAHLDTSCTLTQYGTIDASKGESGVIRFYQDGTDNDQASIQMGQNTAGICKIDPTDAAEDFALAFECRYRQSTVSNTLQKLFFGLANPGVSDDNGLMADATTSMADVAYLGFWVDEADGDDLMFCFHKASGTVHCHNDMDALVADTWTKIGFLYLPWAPSDRKIQVYVDGVEVAAGRVSNSSTNGTGDTTNFPGAVAMAPAIVQKIGAGTSCTMDVDWIACGWLMESDV